MDNNSKLEIIKLTTKEILLSFIDLSAPFFISSSLYRQPFKKYLNKRENDRIDFMDKITYLKRHGYILTFTKGKEKYLELTPKGQIKARGLLLEEIAIVRPKTWDKKWRVVIFDIPEEKRHRRDLLRLKLQELGFIQIQKSVYVFPFECTNEISEIANLLYITPYVTIMISEIIQGEQAILKQFLDNGILLNSDLKK